MLGDSIEQLQKCIYKLEQEYFTSRLLSLDLEEDVFSVCIAGEFSRGKSHLINRLLSQTLLPTGVLPTTSYITKIQYTKGEHSLSFVGDDGSEMSYPLEVESWEQFITQEKPLNGFLRVHTQDNLLQKCQIIDTPGVGDLSNERVSRTYSQLVRCSAAIVTVSASIGLSLSEKAFVEQYLILRETPYVAIVITKLDEIKPSERQSVIDYLTTIIRKWMPDLPVWCSEPYSSNFLECSGIDNIKQKIIEWSNDKNRVVKHRMFQLQQYILLLHESLSYIHDEIFSLQSQEHEMTKRLQEKAFHDIEMQNLDLESKHLQLGAIAREIEDNLQKKLTQAFKGIEAELHSIIKSVEDPKEWIQQEFPLLLNHKLVSILQIIVTDFKSQISTYVMQEYQNINSVMLRKISQSDIQDLNIATKNSKILEFQTRNLMRKVGLNIASAAISFVSKPAAVVVRSIGGMANDYLDSRNVRKQKQILTNELKDLLAGAQMQTLQVFQQEMLSIVRQIEAILSEERQRIYEEAKGLASLESYGTYHLELAELQNTKQEMNTILDKLLHEYSLLEVKCQ